MTLLRFRTDSAVDVDLRAFHTDPLGGEGRHEHVWNIELEFAGEPFRDQRLLRKALETFLEPYQGKDLPWWSSEEIGRAVLTLGTGDPIACTVKRDGFKIRVARI